MLQGLHITGGGVVDHNNRHREFHAPRGFQLTEHHVEATVTGDCGDHFIGSGKLGADGAGQSIADRGEAAIRHILAAGAAVIKQ